MSKDSRRTEGIKLVARKEGEFWFVDSVFDHGDGLAGVTGTICYPISEEQIEELLSIDNLKIRYEDHWEEKYKYDVDETCKSCDGWINEDGCEYCGYPSLCSFCEEVARYDGIDAVIEDLGYPYTDALIAVGEDAQYAGCTGCGRIFSSYGCDNPMSPDDFDEIYDKKALIALLAYESGAVDYDYAVRVVFGW